MVTAPSQPFQCWRIQIDSQLATAFSTKQFFFFRCQFAVCLVSFQVQPLSTLRYGSFFSLSLNKRDVYRLECMHVQHENCYIWAPSTAHVRARFQHWHTVTMPATGTYRANANIHFSIFFSFCYTLTFLFPCQPEYCKDFNKKLSYRRGTARCVVSIEILPIATQQCRNYLYDNSWPNRWYEVGDLVGGNAW